MKSICLIFLLLSASFYIHAQDLSISPDVLSVKSIENDKEQRIQYQVHNNTDTTISWYWTLAYSEEWPDEWQVGVTDQLASWWPVGVGTMEIVPGLSNVLPPQSSTLDGFTWLKIDTYEVAGSGTIIFCVHQDTSYQNPVACTSFATSVNEANTGVSLKVYPNPATDNIYVNSYSKVLRIELLDSNGRHLKTSIGQDQLDLSAIPSGLYLVKVWLEGEKIPHTELVTISK